MVKFGTLDYYKLVADALSKDEAFSKSGFTTTFAYIFSDVLGVDGKPKTFLLDINNGQVTASEVKADVATEFSSTGTYALLAGIAKGEINGQKAKMKLNMAKAIKHQGALKRLSLLRDRKDIEY